MVSVLPIRFLGYDTAIYVVAAIIAFLIAYKGHRMWEITSQKKHFHFYLSFVLLGVAFSTIALTSAYTFFLYSDIGEVRVFDQIFGIDDVGYWIYLITSLAAYGLLAYTYTNERKSFLVSLPLTFNYFSYFNVVLFFVAAYLAFRTATNFLTNKNKNSFYVATCFVLLAAYHGLLLFTPFTKLAYVAAHSSLILGFLSLLYVYLKVTR